MKGAIAVTQLIAALALAVPYGAANSQSGYPERPIRIVVPWGAGGGSDLIMRALGESMSQLLGQAIVIENRPGAGGSVGAAAASRAEPDGYTLFNCSIASHGISPAIYANLPYDPASFVPVSTVATAPNVLVVHPSVPAHDLQEFIAWVKAGDGTLNYASAGMGSSPQMSMELLKLSTGLNITEVPYKGASDGMVAVISGQVPMFMITIGASLAPIRAGQVKPIAVTSLTRHPDLPEVPTLDESGVPGYEVTSWNHLCAPAGVPEAILDTLNAAAVKATASQEMRDRMRTIGVSIAGSSRKEMAEFMDKEAAKWKQVAKEANIRLE